MHGGARGWSLLVAVMAVLAAVTALTASAATAADAGLSVEAAESQFFQLLNAARQDAGLAPLASDPALVTIARGWSAHMVGVHQRTGDPVIKPDAPTDCEQSALCHRQDLGTVVGDQAPGWTLIGENLAYGFSVASMHNGLMGSPGHHRNIMGAFDRVGVGVAMEGDGIWVTFDFVQAPPKATSSQAAPNPAPPAPPVVPIGVGARFNAVTPVRLADTRTGAGGTVGPVAAGGVVRIPLAGSTVVPSSASGAVVNLTAVDPQGAGYLTAYPCGATRPLTSALNVAAGETRANAASVALDATGALCVFSSVPSHVVLDLAGWFGSTGTTFTPTSPARLLDSRSSGGPDRSFSVDLSAVVPAGATAATVNLTVTEPVAAGYLTAFPCGTEPPLVSSLNFVPGQTIAGLATVKLGAGGRICLFSPVPTNVVVDVNGAFAADGDTLTTAVPSRFLDTRDGTGGWLGAAGPMQRIELAVGGARGVPAGVTAAVVNLTATGAAAPGYVVAYACDQPAPTASNLNFDSGETAANLATVGVSATGTMCLAASTRAHLVVDLAGWYGP